MVWGTEFLHTHLVLGMPMLGGSPVEIKLIWTMPRKFWIIIHVNNVRVKKSGSFPVLCLLSPFEPHWELHFSVWSWPLALFIPGSAPQANPGCCYILLLFTGSEANRKVLMKHKLYQWQLPVLEAAEKSKVRVCFAFIFIDNKADLPGT